MINEERVRELYQMAVYDETEDKKCHPMGEYYIWDYIATINLTTGNKYVSYLL